MDDPKTEKEWRTYVLGAFEVVAAPAASTDALEDCKGSSNPLELPTFSQFQEDLINAQFDKPLDALSSRKQSPPSVRHEVLTLRTGCTMAEIEKEYILATLRAYSGSKSKTAEVLGISRRSIYNKLAEWKVKA